MQNAARLLILLALPVLAACGLVKDKPPEVRIVEVPVRQYVVVPPALLKRCEWPKVAPLASVIEVARKRKTCLEQYEGQLDGIGKLKAEP